jgi:DNA-binding NarL/FixJ family response regulator
VNVVVADDHRFMRELISARLEREHGRYRVVAQVGNAQDAVATCGELSPDLLVLDINLPDRSGLDVVPEIRRTCPTTRILLCTAFDSEHPVEESVRSGAHGFVPKTNTWDEFVTAVDRVSRGGLYFSTDEPPSQQSVTVDTRRQRVVATLVTRREKEMLALLAGGSTSKEIARKLHVSVLTVETHRKNLIKKLGARNLAGLVVYAVQTGLYRPPSHT